MRVLHGERGTSLVELIIALPIAALIVAGVAGIFYQVVKASDYANDAVGAYTEVQRAGARVSRDAVQAQVVPDNNYGDTGTLLIAVDQDVSISGTEVLILEWTDWDGNLVDVVYSLLSVDGSSLKELQRTLKVNGSVTETSIGAGNLDDSIDPESLAARTRFEWASIDKEVVRMVVTAQVGQVSSTRTYQARPRASL